VGRGVPPARIGNEAAAVKPEGNALSICSTKNEPSRPGPHPGVTTIRGLRGMPPGFRMSDATTHPVDGHKLATGTRRPSGAADMPPARQLEVLRRLEGDTILDIGCDTGSFVRAAADRFPTRTIIGIDSSDENIRAAQRADPALAARFRQMSAYRLDFAEASFDCVTAQEVLEHLEGAALAVKEINRVLRPGGALIVSVPNPYYAWSVTAFIGREMANTVRGWLGLPPRLRAEILSADAAWDRHVHGWTPRTLLALLTANGFDYVEHAYENPTRNRLRHAALSVLPFLGPTQIMKVRKVSAAPRELT
jgi:SAM-dependent methyltransferase